MARVMNPPLSHRESSQRLADRIGAGDRRALSKAITLLESTREVDQLQTRQLLDALLTNTRRGWRIGITGHPGVGKSTFIEALGQMLVELGKQVAVLAIDPSSPRAGGSILGDKTRMLKLSGDPNAFVRASPAGTALGGVARKTSDAMLLCEAAGYDVVLVETVGVGQSECDVADMVDFCLLLVGPEEIDELQGIKRGGIELADAIVVNKADRGRQEQARHTAARYEAWTHASYQDRARSFFVETCSAKQQINLAEIWTRIEAHLSTARQRGQWQGRRADQTKVRMRELALEMFELRMRDNPHIRERWLELEAQVLNGEMTPHTAANTLIDSLCDHRVTTLGTKR